MIYLQKLFKVSRKDKLTTDQVQGAHLFPRQQAEKEFGEKSSEAVATHSLSTTFTDME